MYFTDPSFLRPRFYITQELIQVSSDVLCCWGVRFCHLLGGVIFALFVVSSLLWKDWASLWFCLPLYDCLKIRCRSVSFSFIAFSTSYLYFLFASLFTFHFSTGEGFFSSPASGTRGRMSQSDFPKFSLHFLPYVE